MHKIVLALEPAQFVLVIAALLLLPYVVASMLGHFGRVQNAHAHVNHTLMGAFALIVVIIVVDAIHPIALFRGSMDGVIRTAYVTPVVSENAPRRDQIGDLIRRSPAPRQRAVRPAEPETSEWVRH